MKFLQYLKDNKVYLDGGMGTILQGLGLKPGEHPEMWSITHPEIITKIHRDYFDAGSNVVCTNTFGANLLKFDRETLDSIVKNAINCANKAREESKTEHEKFVALDIGPSGKLLSPFGDLDFEQAVKIISETASLGEKYGADLVIIETMNDSYETKAALLAVKESTRLPVIVSNAYGEDGKLMTGASPSAMCALLEGLGADAIGANCSLGPKALTPVINELLQNASVPVLIKPNAGLPKVEDNKTVYDVLPDEFSDEIASLFENGIRIAGGCCGTTPEYIKALVTKTKHIVPKPITDKGMTVVSSYTHAVKFGKSPLLIGERINPTGKKRMKQALVENDLEYILGEGITQQEKGADILDVNVGLPDIDESEMLEKAVCELQAVINLPLQIDTANPDAMEKALRRYNGKALINSVNGKEESMKSVFPLAKKYGGVIIALTLDENGIPENAEGRVAIAKRILAEAEKYGIDKKNIVFDTLAMTISTDSGSAGVTLSALHEIRHSLGCHTSLGVSNISFGLPYRDAINSTFFALALENGLSAAIMNPYSAEMMKAYYSFKALRGLDENCADYIEHSCEFTQSAPVNTAVSNDSVKTKAEYKSDLQSAIIKGLKEKAHEATTELLKTTPPLDIVQNEIIPALDEVGKGFESKTVYLPQLLMSAESAKSAFECIKSVMVSQSDKGARKCRIVIATVHGDIHDIGKNIVKLLLENYGFDVYDLGKDVPPEVIADKVTELHAPIAALSALMTTTVPAMEATIRLLKEKAPWCKTVVGGAVLNKDYADKIGADMYAKDAMETVRFAESI